MADVRRAFDEIPAPIRKQLEPRLAGIFFAEEIGGTGFTEATADNELGFVVLDHTVLARQSANAWATWKDNTAGDNRMRALHVAMLGRDHVVRLYRQGKLVKTVGPCWGQSRCAYKRTALESALGLPVTR